jgi:hypothetical protein
LSDTEEAPSRAGTGVAEALRPEPGRTIDYQVKPGDHLYRILRDRYKTADDWRIGQYYALVKDLNPERRSWEALREGEIIRLPALDSDLKAASGDKTLVANPAASAMAGRARPGTVVDPPAARALSGASSRRLDLEEALRAPARENLQLLLKIMEATGHEVQSHGEESVPLPEGTVHFDKSTYPVIYSASLRQRAVIDPEGKIPASLKTKLNDPRVGIPVVPIGNGLPIADAVKQLLASLGYQPLPGDRPVMVHEAGVTYEARGDWMALAPAVSNRRQEVMILNLTRRAPELPAYLNAELAKLGVYFHDVVIPTTPSVPAIVPISAQHSLRSGGPPKELPKDKRELVDALLLFFQVPFRGAENVSVELRDGLRMETLVDRLIDIEGNRTAIFFRRADPVIRQSLQEKHNTKTLELEIDSVSSRAIINHVLAAVGEQSSYTEHRFSMSDSAARERLILKAWGFNVKKKPMFVTDRQIPAALQRFFFEKGLEIVYFQ